MNIPDHLSDPVKHAFDLLSVGALAMTLLSWLPAATAILVFIWTAMRVFESWQNIQINRRKLGE